MILRTLSTFIVLQLIISYSNVESFSFNNSQFNAERDVSFLLSSRSEAVDDGEIYQYDQKDAVSSSTFDPAKPSTFLIHGFMEDRRVRYRSKLSK